MPSIADAIALDLQLGGLTNPTIRCRGVSLDTGSMSEPDALRLIAPENDRLGLPVADPLRGGASFEALVAACLG